MATADRATAIPLTVALQDPQAHLRQHTPTTQWTTLHCQTGEMAVDAIRLAAAHQT